VAFGSGGPAAYFYRLASLVRQDFPSFNPDGLEEHLRETADERRQKADDYIREIQQSVPQYVVSRLQEIYPGPNFLDLGIKNQEILVDAFRKRTQTPVEDQEPLETYIDFIDFRKIVEAKENWPHFEQLSIQLPEEKKGQVKYLRWFDEVNRLRRIPAHPFGKRYKDKDIEILNFVYNQLENKNII
jgi:hypothetical protein